MLQSFTNQFNDNLCRNYSVFNYYTQDAVKLTCPLYANYLQVLVVLVQMVN